MLDDKLNIGVKTTFFFFFALHYFPQTFMIPRTRMSTVAIFF